MSATPAPARAAAVAAEGSGWVACSFDGVTLLLPRADMGARLEVSELQPGEPGAREIGRAQWRERSWPVYRLTRELALAAEDDGPGKATTAVLIRAGDEARGIACEQLRSFDNPTAVTVHPMPGCLRRRVSPIAALGLYETLRVGLVIRGEDFIRHLDGLSQAD